MEESSRSTNSVLKSDLSSGTASMILTLGFQPVYSQTLTVGDDHYVHECTSDVQCEYLLKNEFMISSFGDDVYVDSTEKIVHAFIDSLVNSTNSPAHFSKTVDKHFWDLA